ncbi:ester cyclase [Planotetraspora kaengkrachanensis]|nr:ester cyclase [Planotetraspora kaengkrachanensis]
MSTFWDVKRRLTDAINSHDLDRVLECFSPDAVVVSPYGVAEGREQIAWMYEQLFTGFSDFTLTTWFEVTGTDIPMVAEWTSTGTHTGPFLLPDGNVLEGTGRRIAVRGTCASFVENGKITTHREYFDQLEMYTQLGMGLVAVDQVPPSDREELAPQPSH